MIFIKAIQVDERPRLEKFWSEHEIWDVNTTKSSLDSTLEKIDCDNIEKNVYQTLDINGLAIRSIHIDNTARPHLLIDNLSASISSCLTELSTRLIQTCLVILLGTSGCGKTRTIFEYLTKKYGLYFTFKGSREDQYIPGSSDFQFFLERMENRLKKYPSTDFETAADNQKYVERFIQCIFIARLYLLDYLRRKLGDRLSPEIWLYIQLFPERVYADNLFTDLVEILRHTNDDELSGWVSQLVQKFPEIKLASFLVMLCLFETIFYINNNRMKPR